MKYTSLNDAAHDPLVRSDIRTALAEGETEVWYRKEHAGALFGIEDPNSDALEATHALIGKVASKDLDKLFMALQGDFWSPCGEANGLMQASGAQHTSISVGDVLVIDGEANIVRGTGFEILH